LKTTVDIWPNIKYQSLRGIDLNTGPDIKGNAPDNELDDDSSIDDSEDEHLHYADDAADQEPLSFSTPTVQLACWDEWHGSCQICMTLWKASVKVCIGLLMHLQFILVISLTTICNYSNFDIE
jgi:hypothetical protein